MITVYYAKTPSFLKEEDFQFYLKLVEKKRREKLRIITNDRARIQGLCAGVLLQQALCTAFGFPKNQAFSIDYEKGGKPFLADYPEICFNLSHSGAYVCCAFGKEPVGVDIQQHTKVREGLAERFFTQEDNRRLMECQEEEKSSLFFRMWSIKESYMKLTGRGIGEGLSSFEIDWERNAIFKDDKAKPEAYFEEQACLLGYSLCVCRKKQGKRTKWKELPLFPCAEGKPLC